MKEITKKIVKKAPVFIKKISLLIYEYYFFIQCKIKESLEYTFKKKQTSKKNILIYHITGLNFGGTEKNLQSIANGLCNDYNIFFMFSDNETKDTRIEYVDEKIKLIKFTYTARQKKYPYYIQGMNPHIKNILKDNAIDLIITADSGHTQYPINTIFNVPIIMINIFGSPNMQKNIVKNIFISKTIQLYSEQYTGKLDKNISMCIPVKEPPHNIEEEIHTLKEENNIKEEDFVFGRIGRNSDSIFDYIGIRAFQKIASEYPQAKYLIMSPPPILEKLVQDEKIPNVIFLQPSSKEEDVWAFHKSIDCLAHFRKDGETFGLNIAESMLVGNPIISHKSHIWNAHTEYLDTSFSRVAGLDDIDGYASFMKEFITIKENNPTLWQQMRTISKEKGCKLFSEDEYIKKIKMEILKIKK